MAFLGVHSRFSDKIKETVQNTRNLTEEEKRSISGLKMRYAQAIENETIEDFSKRSNNEWDSQTTRLMNGLEDDTKLEKGQFLKIVVEEPYIN